jgi:hypothetical protein
LQQTIHHCLVGFPVRFGDSTTVAIQRHCDGGVPHQFLLTKHSRRVTLTEARLREDVEGRLGRELTPGEQGEIVSQIIDSQHSDVSSLTKDEYQDYVMEVAQYLKQQHATEAAAAQALADAANPPVERWTKEATELGTSLGARIGTFAAMHDVVEKVNQHFAALKDAIDVGNLPPSARIMPDYPWKKTTKDGKHTTNEKGFLDFQDYCLVVLKRGKSAVYSMLKNAKMPREKSFARLRSCAHRYLLRRVRDDRGVSSNIRTISPRQDKNRHLRWKPSDFQMA